MPDQDIFGENSDTTQTTPAATPPVDPNEIFADKLKQITNDDGNPKYDSVEKALEALKASQDFIKTLKDEKSHTAEELQKAKEELAKMGNIDEFVKRITPTQTKEPEQTSQPESLSEEKVTSLVQKALQERESKSQQEKNLSSVLDKLSGTFKDKAAEHVAARARELGTTPAELKELAKTQPQLALAALMQGAPKEQSASPRSSLQSNSSPTSSDDKPVFEKGFMQGGASSKQLAEKWKEVGAYTHKKLGVTNSPYS